MGYQSERLRRLVLGNKNWDLEIVKRPRCRGIYPEDVEPPLMPAFNVLLKRLVVERYRLALSQSQIVERLRMSVGNLRNDDLSGDGQFDDDAFGKQNTLRSAGFSKIKTGVLRIHFSNSF